MTKWIVLLGSANLCAAFIGGMSSNRMGVARHATKVDIAEVLPEALGTASEALLDTVEDVTMHVRRFAPSLSTGREKLVVLGSGWSAHALAKIIDVSKFEVTVVSPVNHFCFTPMLPSAAVGTVEYRSMTETMRRANPLVDYVQASAVSVDSNKKTVLLDDGSEVPYDKLVCGVGVRVNDKMVPGAAEHCYRLKQVEDAVRLRSHISECFDRAARKDSGMSKEELEKLLTFVVVGGGPTGVELAGELCDFIKDTKNRLFPRLGAAPKVVLVHSGDQLLQQFEESQRLSAAEFLKKEKVDLKFGIRVNEVRKDEIVLTPKSGGQKTTLPYGTCVWCAGTAAQPLMEKFFDNMPPEAQAGKGYIAIDDWLRVRGVEDVFALGDCARIPHKNLPPTAQVAAQQGAFLGRFLNRGYDHSSPPKLVDKKKASSFLEKVWIQQFRQADTAPPFDFLDLGMLAYVGGGKALSQLKFGEVNLGAYSGSAAYLLWKSVYIVKQVATRNRVLVTFDWFKTALFGRDVTRL